MSTAPLAPHIHLAQLGDDLVLLDIRADTYLCIPEGVSQLRPAPDRSALSPENHEILTALLDANIVVKAASGRRISPPILPGSDVGSAMHRVGVREVLRLGASLMDLLWRYRGKPLSAIVSFVSSAPASDAAARPEILRLAQLFNRVAAWLPISRKCLVRSFVLLRFLQRSGQNAQWVFGVRTWPFAAHCWLQVDDIALDDVPERLAEYEPIFVVG